MIRNKVSSTSVFTIVMIVFTGLIICFIWGNSCIPNHQSMTESSAAKNAIEYVAPQDSSIFKLISRDIRKSAHVFEYFVLGLSVCICSLLTMKNCNKIQKFWNIFSFSLFISVVDESIQIFSGRGPAIKDVLIDICGATAGIVIVLIIFYFVKLYKSIKISSK